MCTDDLFHQNQNIVPLAATIANVRRIDSEWRNDTRLLDAFVKLYDTVSTFLAEEGAESDLDAMAESLNRLYEILEAPLHGE